MIQSANTIFDLNLRWYFLEDVPYLSLILTILIFVLYILSEYLKEKSSKAKE
ncbi:epilancin biosynthesis-related protein ElxI1 [Staphylococcus delphini]|uniref:epilancin biosynthesis-related protein ElxI1 n=1 Tax=Staphylococcus delphini TaxID=53344 RepID=UPI003BB10309